jgi:alpha-1,2-mannosyltransferase
MYTTMLALSHAFVPPSNKDGQRTLAAVMYFTLGAVLGWPFALAIAIPFVFEELFVFGADQVAAKEKLEWQLNRGIRLLLCGAVAAIILVSMMPCLRLAFTERCADACSRNRFILLWQAYCSVLEHREV